MGGLNRQKGWDKEFERVDYFRQSSDPLGKAGTLIRQITSLELTRKFQTDSFKLPFLGEAETTVGLGIKSWWTLAQVNPFWVFFFPF